MYKHIKKINILILILVSALLNLLLYQFIDRYLELPVPLDALFTAISAVCYGPAAGVLTGLFTGLFFKVASEFSEFYDVLALCNIITGFLLGILSKKEYLQTYLQLTITIVCLSIMNAVLGSFFATYFSTGNFDSHVEQLRTVFLGYGFSVFYTNLWARIPVFLIDNMIIVYIAFFVKKYIFLSIKTSNMSGYMGWSPRKKK